MKCTNKAPNWMFWGRKVTSTSPSYSLFTARKLSISSTPTKAEDDFLTRHGGKIAVGSIFFVGGLIYRWILGGQDRSSVENSISMQNPIDPLEIAEVRHTSSISAVDYKRIVIESASRCTSPIIRYSSFVEIVHSLVPHGVQLGHIIDRIVLHKISATSSIGESEGGGFKVSIHFLLTALLYAVKSSSEERANLLFYIKSTINTEPGAFDVLS